MRTGRVASRVASLLMMFFLVGCAAAPTAPQMVREAVAVERAVAGTPYPAATAPPKEPVEGQPSPTQGVSERMIVRTGEVVARVKDVQLAIAQVRALAQQYGGYVVNLNAWSQDDEMRATLTIRVPAERFDQAMDQIGDMAEKVERSSVSGEDVTEEYYDLEARLRALKATEQQLLLLLEDVRERMETAEDILAVYRELQRIQSEIEQLEGRRRYLERMVALSTVNVTLLPPEKEPPVVSGEWQPLRTVRRALGALASTGQTLVDILIWAVLYLLPVVLILAAPIAVLVVVLRALMRRRRATSPGESSGGTSAQE